MKVNYRMPLTIGWRSRINVTIQVHIFFVTITIHAGVLDVAGAEVRGKMNHWSSIINTCQVSHTWRTFFGLQIEKKVW